MKRCWPVPILALLLLPACDAGSAPTLTATGARALPVPTITALPILTPTALPNPTLPPATPRPILYTVKAGATLANIAARFTVMLHALAEASKIADVNLFGIGHALVIPPPAAAPTWPP